MNDLKALQHLIKECEELRKDINRLRTSGEGCTSNMSDMPRSSEVSDRVGNAAAEISDLTKEYENLLKKVTSQKVVILHKIGRLQDPVHRRILRQKYLNGKTLYQISGIIGYCHRHTERMHAEALKEYQRLMSAETVIL